MTRPDFNQACKIHDFCYKRAIDKCSTWWCKLLKICTGKMYVTNYNWQKDKDTGKVTCEFKILAVLSTFQFKTSNSHFKWSLILQPNRHLGTQLTFWQRNYVLSTKCRFWNRNQTKLVDKR